LCFAENWGRNPIFQPIFWTKDKKRNKKINKKTFFYSMLRGDNGSLSEKKQKSEKLKTKQCRKLGPPKHRNLNQFDSPKSKNMFWEAPESKVGYKSNFLKN
jgi:hypothetical protein